MDDSGAARVGHSDGIRGAEYAGLSDTENDHHIRSPVNALIRKLF